MAKIIVGVTIVEFCQGGTEIQGGGGAGGGGEE